MCHSAHNPQAAGPLQLVALTIKIPDCGMNFDLLPPAEAPQAKPVDPTHVSAVACPAIGGICLACFNSLLKGVEAGS
jgi:hypothetical protein